LDKPVRAKKHLGQHFLHDRNVGEKIIKALLEKDPDSAIIEVGPGTGILTSQLIDKADFHAIEIDREAIAYLKNIYPGQADKIIESDFLKTDLFRLAGSRFNIVGNFPYNISSQILFRLLDYKDNVSFLVGMFQKEVAERVAEKPGTKKYGILSVLLQAYYNIEYLFTVPEGAFDPPPKVKSAVIRLSRNDVKKLACDEKLFRQIVKQSFNQRRKTIRNSLKSLLRKGEDHPLLTQRPEQLSVNEFMELTNLVSSDDSALKDLDTDFPA
jgi:16S rRNA (adenine1518-N6/adenine1519-N6)-dimethyltransferase